MDCENYCNWIARFLDVPLWQSVFATLFGVCVGIPIALCIDRKIKYRKIKQEQAELLPVIRGALEHNRSLLDQLLREFNENGDYWIPTYSLDLILLDSTSVKKYNIGIPPEICRSVDNARYELSHLDEKLRLIRISNANSGQANAVFAYRLAVSSRLHIPLVQQSVADALGRISGFLIR